MRGHTARLALLMALSALVAVPASAQPAESPSELELVALSNRADLVSDGNMLVEVVLPADADLSELAVWIAKTRSTTRDDGSRDVTDVFAVRKDGRVIGLVGDLPLGGSVLTARLGDGRGAWLDVTNHPNGGPVFSGPQLQPWDCRNEAAVDEQCNQPPEFSYLYQSTDGISGGLQPYDPANPPDDVATTTTDQGVEVPFIVRVEVGYQNRDQYRIAVLHQPGEPWEPWAPQEQWNGKMFIAHGGGCGGDYRTGSAPTGNSFSGTFDFLPPELEGAMGNVEITSLARGFAMVSTAMSNTGHNCSHAMNAESLMMAKEHFVESYGEIRYTIGSGCSGGSIAQQTVANAYPGIYQGLTVTCSYPDTSSPAAQFLDGHLMRLYFENPDRWGDGVVWSPTQWGAVEGHISHVNTVVADEFLLKAAIDPTGSCGVPDEVRYHPESNPGGVRCGVIDFLINLFGPREPDDWELQEQQLGRGFGGVPFDNVGVQYGLEALQSGQITPDQFVDLNLKIGGLNIDALPVPERFAADEPAIQNMYRTGWLNSASNLDTVPIIDHGGPDPGVAHDAMWAWTMRERLQREQGHFDNHVIWFGAMPVLGDPNYPTEAFLAMDRWLAAVEADDREVPLADKIVQGRPGDLRDRCSQVSGLASPDTNLPLVQPTLDTVLGPELGAAVGEAAQSAQPVLDPAFGLVIDPALGLVCGAPIIGDTLQARFSTPSGVAGQSSTYDDHKCQLRPLDRDDDYGVLGLTDAQWEQMQQIFPDGVCDWSQPGVGKQDAITWMHLGSADINAYGGEPLGPAPVSVPFGPGDGHGSPMPATGGGAAALALVLIASATAASARLLQRSL